MGQTQTKTAKADRTKLTGSDFGSKATGEVSLSHLAPARLSAHERGLTVNFALAPLARRGLRLSQHGLAEAPGPRQNPDVSTEPPGIVKPPGFFWIVLLGGVGFAAGFFGSMMFVPESNQGPVVGIFLTGPGGLALGLLLFLLMKVWTLTGRAQWIFLTALAGLGTLTTLYFVQPAPAPLGYELELTIERSHPPGESADAVIADWKKRITRVTWAAPHAGWEAQMRTALAGDPGLVLGTVLLRQRTIKEHRKPWNRSRRFATPWQPVPDKKSYYLRPDARALAGTPSPARLFLRSDSTAPIRAPDVWPPLAPEAFIGFSRLEADPAGFVALP